MFVIQLSRRIHRIHETESVDSEIMVFLLHIENKAILACVPANDQPALVAVSLQLL